MKGLIRNNFYSMAGNMKTAFIMSAVLIFSPLVLRQSELYSMIIAVQIFFFIANIGTSLHADKVVKWDKYERTLPLKQSSVIAAKYISFCILILSGLAMSLLTCLTAALSVISLNSHAIIWGYQYGLTLAIYVTAIAYPAMLKFGTEKNELILILSGIVSVAIMLLITFLMSPFTGGMNFQSTLVGSVSVIISPLFLLSSYFVSLYLYKKKEF